MSISKITSNSIAPNISLTGEITVDAINASGTEANKIPTGTTAQRPENPSQGMIRFNTETNSVEEYSGTEWVSKATTGKAIAMSIVFGG